MNLERTELTYKFNNLAALSLVRVEEVWFCTGVRGKGRGRGK